MLILKRVRWRVWKPVSCCTPELSQRAYCASRMPTCVCLSVQSKSTSIQCVFVHHEQKGIFFLNFRLCSSTLSLKSAAYHRIVWHCGNYFLSCRVRWENWYRSHVWKQGETASLAFVQIKQTRAATTDYYCLLICQLLSRLTDWSIKCLPSQITVVWPTFKNV